MTPTSQHVADLRPAPAVPLLLGVDVGTTWTKAAVVAADGQELSWGSVPTPWERVPTGAETTPQALLDAVLRAAAAALDAAPPGAVAGAGVTSMAETAIWLDRAGRPVAPCIAWYDTRGRDEAAELAQVFGERVFASRTGLPISAMCTLAKLSWLRRQGYEVPARVQSVADWVVHALGGEQVSEASLASRTGALLVPARDWWDEALDWAGLAAGSLPPVVQAGEPAGKADLEATAAVASTLADGYLQPLERLAGASLASAGHDHLSAAAGVGAVSPAQVLDSCGTAESLVRAVPPLDDAGLARVVASGFAAGWHTVPGHHAVLAGSPLGMLLERVLRLLGRSGPGGLDGLDAAAAGISPGALRVRSAGFFADPSVEGLHPEVSPEALWNAALDEVAGVAAKSLSALQQLAGPAGELLVSGGWARCQGLRRRKAALLPCVRWPAVVEAGARGAALFGGVAAGLFEGPFAFPVPGDNPSGSA
jgi:sugar (pentulose or hexulose) kinase